jgi:sugar diacid utilization regulator
VADPQSPQAAARHGHGHGHGHEQHHGRECQQSEPNSAELCRWLDAIAEITRAANQPVPVKELLDLVAGTTARLTGYEFCAVFVPDPRRESLIIEASYGLSKEYVEAINTRAPIPVRAGDTGAGPSSRAFRAQRPATVFDFRADGPSRVWQAMAAEQGYSSLLSVPLAVRKEPFGLLNCYTVAKHHFTAREVMLVESLANQAGLAIETTRRLTEAQERVRELADASAAQRTRLDSLERAEIYHDELLRIVLDGAGLPAIADSLASRFHCTVVIDDATGRVLASASREGPASDRRVAATYQRARSRVGTQADGRPSVLTADGTGGLVVPVVLDGNMAGHLWALCPRTPFGEPHRLALTRGAGVVAFALLKERTAREVEWRLSRDLFDDLLDAEGRLDEALYARTRQLGVDLTEPQTLLVVRRDTGQSEPNGVHQDREAYAQRSLLSLVERTGAAGKGATLMATRGDHVVLLWRDDEHVRSATEFAHHLRREIVAYAGGWTATICVGPRCVDIQEYADAYRLTCSVLDLAQLSERRDRVVELDETGAYRLLLQVKRPQELHSFARSVLAAVHAYDEQHQAKLASTLRCYMAHRCNATLTAQALHVHANTVGYRLRRIEGLLGIELDDPESLLQIQLALMIESILNG